MYLSAGYRTFRISFATLTLAKGLWMFYCVSLNVNPASPGGDSKQKLSCVWQLPSYQSGDLISFLKGPIVSSEACEIAGCWVTVNGGAAGRWVGIPEQPQLWGDGRCEDLTPPAPAQRLGSCWFQPRWNFAWQIPLQIWVTSTSQTVRWKLRCMLQISPVLPGQADVACAMMCGLRMRHLHLWELHSSCPRSLLQLWAGAELEWGWAQAAAPGQQRRAEHWCSDHPLPSTSASSDKLSQLKLGKEKQAWYKRIDDYSNKLSWGAPGGKIIKSFFPVMACSYTSAIGYLINGLKQKSSSCSLLDRGMLQK